MTPGRLVNPHCDGSASALQHSVHPLGYRTHSSGKRLYALSLEYLQLDTSTGFIYFYLTFPLTVIAWVLSLQNFNL